MRSMSSRGLVTAAVQAGSAARISSAEVGHADVGNGEKHGLLDGRFSVKPTSSRLVQGIKDLIALVLIAIPFLIFRIARYALIWIGVTEHR